MEVIIEEFLTYGFILLLIFGVMYFYIRRKNRKSNEIEAKISLAKEEGLYEPVSLYPVVDPKRCIGSGACIKACPEHDILGLRNGKATIINASQCIGHGACFRACPVEAISLWIGTEKRGVDLPHVLPTFETNVPGIFIAGELGGMGLIRNAVTQGREAVENIAKSFSKNHKAEYDLIVVGAGPAGISASLAAKKAGLKVLTLEQDTLGGSVFTYPRSKIVMTHPVDLPLHGKVKLMETSKDQLLDLWNSVLNKHNISIIEKSKVEAIRSKDELFELEILNGKLYTSKTVLLALGRRGTPRKLNIPGEMSQKVAYRLLDPELIKSKNIVVVGGGDSAIESALLLANENKVTLSYRNDKFSRLKPRNAQLIKEAIISGLLNVKFNSNLISIDDNFVTYTENETSEVLKIENDLVYIFVGGELPTEFLKKTGIIVKTKYGDAVLKHK
ncbi:MAG TPA: NAD(P)-binding domain-containing protein [Paludibacter sp.]|nr:NAD(P)-binding domain-containing protein [Paludibacter sp.]